MFAALQAKTLAINAQKKSRELDLSAGQVQGSGTGNETNETNTKAGNKTNETNAKTAKIELNTTAENGTETTTPGTQVIEDQNTEAAQVVTTKQHLHSLVAGSVGFVATEALLVSLPDFLHRALLFTVTNVLTRGLTHSIASTMVSSLLHLDTPHLARAISATHSFAAFYSDFYSSFYSKHVKRKENNFRIH